MKYICTILLSFLLLMFSNGCASNPIKDSSYPPFFEGDKELSWELYKRFDGHYIPHTIFIKYGYTNTLSQPLVNPETGHKTFFVTIASFNVATYGTSKLGIEQYHEDKEMWLETIATKIKEYN